MHPCACFAKHRRVKVTRVAPGFKPPPLQPLEQGGLKEYFYSQT